MQLITPQEARRDLRRNGYLRRQVERYGGEPDQLAGLSAARIRETLQCMPSIAVGVSISSGVTFSSGGVALPTTNLIGKYLSDQGVTEDQFGVTEWQDQHTSLNHITQAADSRKPPTIADALDGFPSIHFDGGSVNLHRDTLTGGARGAQSTVFLVVKLDTTATNPGVLCGNDDASTTYRIQHNTTKWGVFQGSLQSEASGTADTSWHMLSATFGALDTLFVDGVEVLSGDAGTTTADGIGIGRGSASALFEATAMLVYDTLLDTSTRQQVERWLKQRYPSLPALP